MTLPATLDEWLAHCERESASASQGKGHLVSTTSTPAQAKGRYGAAVRYHGVADPRVSEAKRDLTAATIEAFVERKLAESPQLTDDQVERIAGLLRGVPDAAA